MIITWMKLVGPQAAWKRITPKGIKKVHGPSSGNKNQIKILACSNVVGNVLLPIVILKGECLNYEWTKGEIPRKYKWRGDSKSWNFK